MKASTFSNRKEMKQVLALSVALFVGSIAFAQSSTTEQAATTETSVSMAKPAKKGGCCASMAATSKSCCSKGAQKQCGDKAEATRKEQAEESKTQSTASSEK